MFGQFQEVYELAKPYLNTRNNDIHMKVSYAFCSKLLEIEGGIESIVKPAVILHDVGWKMVPEELQLKAFGPKDYDRTLNRVHEVEGSRLAREILQQLKWDTAVIDEIAEIILGHDSRKAALSINDALVKDADKLWRYSPEALVIDCERFHIDPDTHVKWLGTQIDEWFITDSAIKLAREELESRFAGLRKD
ncbi:MAG: HD domain-containing protein [Syntrophaceae bacterium]|nr:HD domain-containing protein [Syntrophaceae bacterium]